MKYFHTNLKSLRTGSKLKQAEITSRLKIEPSTWSNYERGVSFPNLKLFHEISKYFDVSEDILLNIDLQNVEVSNKTVLKRNIANVEGNVENNVETRDQNKHLNSFKEPFKNVGNEDKKALETANAALAALDKEILTLKGRIGGLEYALSQQGQSIQPDSGNGSKTKASDSRKHKAA